MTTNIIQTQLIPWDVHHPEIHQLISATSREHFLDDTQKHLSQTDCKIPLKNGGSLLPTKEIARMLQALHPFHGSQALEIGSSGGYVGSLLSQCYKHVSTFIPNQAEIERQNSILDALGIRNIKWECTNGLTQKIEQKYDLIWINGGIRAIPENLFQCLTDKGQLMALCGPGKIKSVVHYSSSREPTVLFETIPGESKDEPPPPFIF